jgi:hypothetical protein
MNDSNLQSKILKLKFLENTMVNGNKSLGSSHKNYESKKISFFDQNIKNKLNTKVDYSDIDEQKGLTSPKFLFRKRKMDFQFEKTEKATASANNVTEGKDPLIMNGLKNYSNNNSNNSGSDDINVNKSKN